MLRYIAQGIPTQDRWQPIFARYVGQVAASVAGLGVDPNTIAASADDPGLPGDVVVVKDECFTGQVSEILYDCHGRFVGFVVESCAVRHHFATCERGIEEVVRRACRDREQVTVCVDGGRAARIARIVLHCC